MSLEAAIAPSSSISFSLESESCDASAVWAISPSSTCVSSVFSLSAPETTAAAAITAAEVLAALDEELEVDFELDAAVATFAISEELSVLD